MALQSEYKDIVSGVLNYPSTKYIPNKDFVRVYLKRIDDDSWDLLSANNYDIVNNSVVLRSEPSGNTYYTIEIRVADNESELADSQSDISIVAGIASEVSAVAGIENEVVTVAGISTDVTSVAAIDTDVTTVAGITTEVTDVSSISSNVVDVSTNPLRQEILDAPTNAATATTKAAEALSSANNAATSETNALQYRDDALQAKTDAEGAATSASTSETNSAASATTSQLKAWEAEAEKLTADSYATEPENTFVKTYTSNGDGTFTQTTTNEYSSLHYSKKSEAAQATVETFASNVLIDGTVATTLTPDFTDTDTTTADYSVGDIIQSTDSNLFYVCTAASTAGALLTDINYFSIDTTNTLTVTDGVYSYTDGKDSNGYVRSTESLSGTTTIDFAGVSDGYKWVAKTKSGGYGFYNGLSNGLYNKEHPDDNRLVFLPEEGKTYTTTGGELVTNGDFTVDTSGWTSVNSAILSIVNGQMEVKNGTGAVGYAYQQLTLEVGKKYRIKATGRSTAITVAIYLSTTTNDLVDNVASIVSGVANTTITGEIEFTAQQSTYYLINRCESTTSGDLVYVDDISVYKLEATLDQQLTTSVSFLPNPIMVASETPQYIDYNQKLLTNVTDSLEVGKLSVTDGFDLGQTWVDETANRASGVTYTNNTGRPIQVSVTASIQNIQKSIDCTIDGISIQWVGGSAYSYGQQTYASFIVPASSTYSVFCSIGSFIQWSELK